MKTQDREALSVISEVSAIAMPVYQRQYEWDKEEVQKLLEDINDVRDDSTDVNKHFIGNIITHPINRDELKNGEFLTDGQQRLTTLTLIIIAIAAVANEHRTKRTISKEQKENMANFSDEIMREFVRKKSFTSSNAETILKLKQSSGDDIILQRIVNRDIESLSEEDKKRPIYKNYRIILSWLNKNVETFEGLVDFFNAMRTLYCVKMQLDEDEDPQRIFESMNTNGKPISLGSQINNYMINRVAKGWNTYYQDYEEKWKPIENFITPVDKNQASKRNQTEFFKSSLQVRNPAKVADNTMYSTYKNHIEKSDLEFELKELTILAEIYHKMDYTHKVANKDLRREIDRFNKNILPDALIMKILLDLYKERISEKVAIKSLKFINDWDKRLSLSANPWSSVENMKIHSLYFRIDYSNYYEYIRHFLLSIKNSPSDESIREFLTKEDFQNKSKEKLARDILITIESANSKDKIEWGEYTLEHILPQNPANLFSLTEDESRQLKEIQYKLGNLTLSPNNSELSNKSFIEKRDMPDRPHCAYKNSKLSITRQLSIYQKWEKEEVQSRTELLVEQILGISKIDIESNDYNPDLGNNAYFAPLDLYDNAKKICINDNCYNAQSPSELFKHFIYTIQDDIKKFSQIDDEFRVMWQRYKVNIDDGVEFAKFVSSPSAIFRTTNTQIHLIRLCLSHLSRYLASPLKVRFYT